MDTGTHIVMGIGLTALAMHDPSMSGHFGVAATTLIASSLVPDSDTVLKLKNNAAYISNHRGITHSIPFTLLWPILITLLVFTFSKGVNPMHIWLWAQLGVFLHVFVDIFNSYGTQALRPFSNKWIQLSVINTFDPYIFILWCLGIVLWAFGLNAYVVFIPIFIILFFYYVVRFIFRSAIKKQVLRMVSSQDKAHLVKVFVAPTIKFMEWRVAVQTATHDYVGKSYGRNIVFADKVKRQEFPDEALMTSLRKDPNIKAFLNFSSIYRWDAKQLSDNIYEVRFIDLRYLKNDHYSFVAIAHLDKDMHITHSYTGWVFSEQKLMKKLYAH
ncbi:metal-dependent hydrolase [Staphylococcus carnosus]|uniref:Metal-dependent hydrolase n=2 Tax=Staphylococcus carnosus TaxID=1281 RepID=B9DMV8_STACT|nr:metal-dependent hydrolase [Staphylococcus carnosus]KOR12348.1 metal-dependent hydrolase [Staphylococcus carnosus]UTB77986.1 metal-dependent hydrolase [Staphylococcus carnosus]UTB87530.1 metal-dependent hydrolase [Staphylococcus carnosus]UTB89882.1 metal-dependent hydrolase [Staphylococcus carnosus]CAL28347.1 conserved hypothetical protein [Staphylococcus carnosus subsp. carnosus TM300]